MPRTLKLVLSPMGGRKRHKRIRGKGIFGDIWNGIKNVKFIKRWRTTWFSF